MILDSQLIFAWQQAVAASAASVYNAAVQPNAAGVVDLTIGRNIGVGTDKLYLVVMCNAAMTDAGSDSTVTASLRTSATITGAIGVNPALSGTINTITTFNAFPALTAPGVSMIQTLDPATYLEYLDIYFTVANGNLTTGSFSAFITTNVDLQTYYKEGFNPN
jgi:hypothetical protein